MLKFEKTERITFINLYEIPLLKAAQSSLFTSRVISSFNIPAKIEIIQ